MEKEIKEELDKIELMFKKVCDAIKENEKQITMLKNDLYNHKKDFQQAILDEQASNRNGSTSNKSKRLYKYELWFAGRV